MDANQYLECRYNKTFRQLQNYKKVSQKNNCSPKRIRQNSIRGTLTDFKLTELATDIYGREINNNNFCLMKNRVLLFLLHQYTSHSSFYIKYILAERQNPRNFAYVHLLENGISP